MAGGKHRRPLRARSAAGLSLGGEIMFYALYRPYGRRTMSLSDTLYRFGTRADRDETIANEQYDGNNYHWQPIDARTARRYFGAAFRGPCDSYFSAVHKWEDARPAGLISGEYWTGCASGGDYAYMN